MAKLTIAPTARADLRDVRIYSKAAFGSRVALSYLDGVREQIAAVLLRERMGKPERDLGEDIRSVGFRSHRIYYRSMQDGILIVRVLHHARDVRAAFETPS